MISGDRMNMMPTLSVMAKAVNTHVHDLLFLISLQEFQANDFNFVINEIFVQNFDNFEKIK